MNCLASNTRPDIALYVMNSARNQKKATLRDLREIDRILAKVQEKRKLSGVQKSGPKDDCSIIGVSAAS